MLTVSNDIKNAYNQYTTQKKSYIRVGANTYFIQNMRLSADAYDEGNVVGNAIAKTLKFDIETQYVSGLDEFELFDGIWTGQQYEYISLGTFKLFEEQGTDDFFSSITAYDKLILFNVPFDTSTLDYPITVYALLQEICSQAGVTLDNLSITNGLRVIDKNLFVEGETLKDILKAICQISGTFAIISEDKLKLLLLNNDNTLTLSNYQISDPQYKRTTWKINQVVLGMEDVDGEYVMKQDDEDVERNGAHRIVINNNPFVYTQELRQDYIDDLFDQLYGFGYIAYEMNWEGLPYVELGDKANIDGYNTLVLRYELASPDGLNSTISAPSIIDSVVEYVDNTSDLENKLRKTEYKVDKAEGNITLLTQQTTEIGNNLSENYYTVEQVNTLVQDSERGVINTFSQAGGNNLLRNTAPYFMTNDTEAEFWDGAVARITDSDSSNGYGLLLQNGSTKQTVQLKNNNYTLSFKYKMLIPLTTASVKYNGKTINLTEAEGYKETTGLVSEGSLTFEAICDTNNGIEIYELMLNTGEVALEWSQNANEMISDYVQISKGVKVSSSVSNTLTTMESDGFKVKNKSTNETVMEATETGARFKEITAGKGTIAGLLIEKVEDEVWITGV